MLRTFAALAMSTAGLAQCAPAPAPRPPTVSLAACSTGTERPRVSWYIVGRGHEVWLTIDGAPLWAANAADTRARAGELPGYLNDDGRTVDVQVSIDGERSVRTLWATKAC